MVEVKKERTVYDTWYKASDGVEFRTKEECEKYEQTARAVVRTKFLKLVVEEGTEWDFFKVGSDENTVYAIKINSQEEADTVLQLYYIDDSYVLEDNENSKSYKERAINMINAAYTEKDILFVGENYEGEIYLINTRNNIIENLKKIGVEQKTE